MTDHTRDIDFEAGDLGYIQASATFETDDEGVTYFARINANGFEISREILVKMTSNAEVEALEQWAADELSREAEGAVCDEGGLVMTFDPTQNRIPTCLLTDDELAALKVAEHGWECASGLTNWRFLNAHDPVWFQEAIYRAKPAHRPMIICNGVEVPEPVREALAKGDQYYLPNPYAGDWADRTIWLGDRSDALRLERGCIHLTEAAAVSHAKAMLIVGVA